MSTATAELCGHRWRTWNLTRPGDMAHRCDEPAGHPAPCRCRCGTTTTREQDTGGIYRQRYDRGTRRPPATTTRKDDQ